ncbi:translation elongation factor 4 [Agarivorans sp. Z349TD_8]|uniref:translation elongation factor 4 n=1 Tax=Agarivorans sp. Z349TD_8 TaxID=3421434 RepID=UPI003D7CFBDF
MNNSNTRNFCIIAHIDHGKSTLADRMIEYTHTLTAREMKDQILDSMDIEQERGITVKLQTVHMLWQDKTGKKWQFNLVDTPGHVDFSSEVSRSITACEGAILLIDATQGVQAQTLANLRLAQQHGLTILPVVNKIDSPQADLARVMTQLSAIDGLALQHIMHLSARTGEGVEALLDTIPKRFPSPRSNPKNPLRAYIFDSHYDCYRGAILHVRIMDGKLSPKETLKFISTGQSFEVIETGYFMPQMTPTRRLNTGDVGYITGAIKDIRAVHVGDTITSRHQPATELVQKFTEIKPMVFCGIYPDLQGNAENLRYAMQKLQLNDASLSVEPHVSESLGAGFRCGFLGMLHREIIEERLKREYQQHVITTAPTVNYRCILKNNTILEVDNPALFPSHDILNYAEEPLVRVSISTPSRFSGRVLELCDSKMGDYMNMSYLSDDDVLIEYSMPLAMMINGFFSELKSASKGYATLDYKPDGYKRSELVRVDIHIDTQVVDALTFISLRDSSFQRGTALVNKLKYLMPRKLYPVPAQAVVNNKAIARVDIPPLRKNMLASGFNGSVSAKQRMIRQQREHRKNSRGALRMEISREIFSAILLA